MPGRTGQEVGSWGAVGLCLLDPRSAGALGPGDGQEGVFVFWGTTAEAPRGKEGLGPFSEQV